MFLIAALAASVWAMPYGSPASKPSADRLPAPQPVMRWQVPSGLSVAKPGLALRAAPVCQQVGMHKADMVARDPQPGARKLSEEPPADEVKAVLYTEGSCSKPIVVRRAIRPAQ